MAKTNSSTRRDVVTRVRRQHDTIRRLFDDVEKATPAGRAVAFQPLVRLLAVHETAEEMVVYPALALAGREPGRLFGPAGRRRTRPRRHSPISRAPTPARASS